MATFEIAEYLAILHDSCGKEVKRVLIVPKKRFPIIGERISLERKYYRVRDIEHVPLESEEYDRFIYTDLVAYLVEEAAPQGAGPDDLRSDDESNGPQLSPQSSQVTAAVIPFRGGPINAASPLLAFLKLAGIAVAVGYQEQAFSLERMKFSVWSLDWNESQWIAEHVADGRSADELRALSRAAKRAGAEAEAYCRELLCVVAVEAEPRVAEVIELSAYRRG